MSENLEELKNMAEELNQKGKQSDLCINFEKTKFLTNANQEAYITIDKHRIIASKDIIYLGQKINANGYSGGGEVQRRITLAWAKFWALKHIFKGPFQNNCVLNQYYPMAPRHEH